MRKCTDWKKIYARARSTRVQRPRGGIGPKWLWVCVLDVKQRSKGEKGNRENLGSNPDLSD